MSDGVVLEKGTGVITLIRYTSLSEDAFTRAADFVPERSEPLATSQAAPSVVCALSRHTNESPFSP